MSLKIKQNAEQPEAVKMTFKLHPVTVKTLQAYLQAYEAEYGKAADPDYVVNEIMDLFFSSDREFQKYLSENPVDELEIKTKKKKPAATGAK